MKSREEAADAFREQVRQTILHEVTGAVRDGNTLGDMARRAQMNLKEYDRAIANGTESLRKVAGLAYGCGFEINFGMIAREAKDIAE